MNKTAQLLDKAMEKHHLKSDYKLALVMGVSHSSLGSYRRGKTLPDSRVIAKICELTDDDSALIAVEMELERATTPEARSVWQNVYARLQSGFSHVGAMAVIAMVLIAGSALPHWATGESVAKAVLSSVYYVKSGLVLLAQTAELAAARFVKLCKAGLNVPLHPHSTARFFA